jgi:AcrR family transcriptional regulator
MPERDAKPHSRWPSTPSPIRNAAALQHAAIGLIAAGGWDEATTVRIGEAAGLTYGAVYARYGDKSDLGAALLEDVLLPLLCTELSLVIEAALDPGAAAAFEVAMHRFVHPSPTLSAAIELVLAARFDARLTEAAYPVLVPTLTERCRASGALDSVAAAQGAATAILAFGLALGSNRPWLAQADMGAALQRFHAAASTPAQPLSLPEVGAEHLASWPFDSGDARVDTLLEAAVQTVGELGYQAASVARICRNARVSQGFLFNRYPSKFDLFHAAATSSHTAGIENTEAYLANLGRSEGIAAAEAIAWREYQRPGLAIKRSVAIEIERLARFHPELAESIHAPEAEVLAQRSGRIGKRKLAATIGDVQLDIGLGLGILVLPLLLPEAWSLPFSAITQPLVAAASG